MTRVKLLIIVTNEDIRRRLLITWREFMVDQPAPELDDSPPDPDQIKTPVAFSRMVVREGLSLSVFIVHGGWRREYVCQALARQVDGYCVVTGPDPIELSLGRDLIRLLAGAGPGMVAAVGGVETQDLVGRELSLPEGTPVAAVDCDDRSSVNELVCELLEQLAAAPAA